MYKVLGWALVLLLQLQTANAFHIEVAGQVKDSATGLPLEGVLIRHDQQGHALTDRDGRFYLHQLHNGHITIEFRLLGYQTRKVELDLEGSEFLVVFMSKEVKQLGNVLVRAPGGGGLLQSRLDPVTLERTRGQSVADWLNRMPGVAVMQTGPAIVKPVFRGLGSQRLMVINDQLRWEGQQWGADHGLEIDPFGIGGMSRLDQVKALTKGPESVGGAIEMQPQPFLSTKGAEDRFSAQGFSNNLQAGVSWLHRQADSSGNYWNLQLSFRKAGDAAAPDYRLSNTGFMIGNGSFRYHRDLKNENYWEFALSHYQGRMGILQSAHIGNVTDLYAAIQRSEPAVVKPFSYVIGRPRQDVGHTAAKWLFVRHRHKADAMREVQHQLSFQRSQRAEYDRVNPVYRSASEVPNFDLWLYVFQYDREFRYRKQNLEFQFGKGILGHWNTNYGKGQLIPDYNLLNAYAWSYVRKTYARWTLQGSGRLDIRQHWSLIPAGYQKYNTVQGFFVLPGFAAAAGRNLSSYLRIEASSRFSSRAPWFNELYAKGLHGGVASFEIGNPNLKQEWFSNTEMALSGHGVRLEWKTTLFYRYAWNFIYMEPQAAPTLTIFGAFPTFLYKQSDVRWYGLEAEARLKITTWLSWSMSAQLLDAWNASLKQPQIYTPGNRARGELFAAFPTVKGSWSASFGAWAVARQTKYPAGQDYALPPNGYVLLDASLNRNWKNWTLQLSVQNLGNQRYRDYLSRLRYFADEPGINAGIKLIYQLNRIKK